jgi:hypothetical protein
MKVSSPALVGTLVVALASASASGASQPRAKPLEGRDVFRLVPCTPLELNGAKTAHPSVVYAGEADSPRVKLRYDRDQQTATVELLDSAGACLAGPAVIAGGCLRLLPAFAGDLNGDGRLDFAVLVLVAPRAGRACCDIGFAVSAPGGYRLSRVRGAAEPGARDFVDVGGRCGLVHAEVVTRTDERGATVESHVIYRLLEFGKDGRIIASSDGRYPQSTGSDARTCAPLPAHIVSTDGARPAEIAQAPDA